MEAISKNCVYTKLKLHNQVLEVIDIIKERWWNFIVFYNSEPDWWERYYTYCDYYKFWRDLIPRKEFRERYKFWCKFIRDTRIKRYN